MIVAGRAILGGEDYWYEMSTKWQGRERFTVQQIQMHLTRLFKIKAERLGVPFDETTMKWTIDEPRAGSSKHEG